MVTMNEFWEIVTYIFQYSVGFALCFYIVEKITNFFLSFVLGKENIHV